VAESSSSLNLSLRCSLPDLVLASPESVAFSYHSRTHLVSCQMLHLVIADVVHEFIRVGVPYPVSLQRRLENGTRLDNGQRSKVVYMRILSGKSG